MTFLAGAAALDASPLNEDEIARFEKALDGTQDLLPAPPARLSRSTHLLAQAGGGSLWQGPRHLSTPELDAAAAGTQWRLFDREDTALGVLARSLLEPDPRPPEAFDGFCCALLPRTGAPPVLATDPVGLFPLCYTLLGRTLVFSSHQTFLRRFLGERARPDIQAALEFLVMGHPLGDRTLLEGVHMLLPGTLLEGRDGDIGQASLAGASLAKEGRDESLSASKAGDRLFERLAFKRDRYGKLCKDPVIGFLSGGWDSRLLVALFAAAGRITETLTTQQRIRLGERYVSEERIALDVAHLLGVENRFVAPAYRDPATLGQRSALLDASTWFHDWAFAMVEAVPDGGVLMLDGLLGDILIRALFLDNDLAEAQAREDREALCRALHRRFLQGFNPYTPGLEAWGAVLRPEILRSFEERLWEDIGDELGRIDHQEAATLFFLRNRSRRAIAPLPRLVFGRKGDVHLPFCDPGFLRLALSLPVEIRRDGSVYRRLLDRAHPGLSRIPSTNEKDPARLAPYLTKALPKESLRGRKDRKKARLEALCAHPPQVFEPLLNKGVREALAARDLSRVEPHLLLLEKIQMLEGFFEAS